MSILRYLQSFLPALPNAPGGAVLAPGPLSSLTLSHDGRLSIYDPAAQTLASATPGAGLLGVADFALRGLASGARQSFVLEGVTRSLPQPVLELLAEAPGQGAQLWFDGAARASAGAAGVVVGDASGFLVLGANTGSGLASYRLGGSGLTQPSGTLADSAARYLGGVSALAALERGSTTFLIAASGRENGVSVLRLNASGQFSAVSDFGLAQGLPVAGVSDLAVARLGGQDFVLVAAAQTSSISVLRLDAAGKLSFASQVADTLHSRFAGVTAMDLHEISGQVFVAAAGQDGGVSVLQLLPNGQLIQRAVFEGHADLGLRAIADIKLVETAGGLSVFLLVPEGRALLRLDLDLGVLGVVGSGSGGADNDLLVAPPEGGSLSGGAGADVLVDGAGLDTLRGGAGGDIFVFGQAPPTGGGRDRIADFQPGLDRIDLSGWQGVYSAAALKITALSNGARLSWGERIIDIYSADGRSLSPEAVKAALVFPLQPVWIAAAPVPDIIGTNANDVLPGTAAAENIYGGRGDDWITATLGDFIDGGPGSDMLSFLGLTKPIDVRMARGEATSGGQSIGFTGIENITGTIHGDYIEGDAGNNVLRGLGDWDWFIASLGADIYDGGTGRDMVSYVYAGAPVTVDLADPSRNTGLAAGDTYTSIERITGTSFNDNFRGTMAEEDFRGMGGDDWFVGSGDASTKDRYDGGAGRDTVAYSSSPTGVTASLLLGRGSGGQAARDLYTGIENLTGSPHKDVLTGDHTRNVLRGLNGNDTLIGNGGNDWLYGGGGNDFIDGGSNWDVAFYEGRRAQYAISTSAGVTTVRWRGTGAGDGTDTLINVEVLRFSDGDYYL